MSQTRIKEQEGEQHCLVAQSAGEARATSAGSVPGMKVSTQIRFTVLGMMPSITQRTAIASHNAGSHLYSVLLFWEF